MYLLVLMYVYWVRQRKQTILLQNHARSLGAEEVTNAVSQVTELATENNGVRKYKSLKRPNSNFPSNTTENNGVRKYKSLKRPNSNFPSNKPENNGARKYKRPNSIFPPTQQRTMEYERCESLKRHNSSCPPRLSLLFSNKTASFF